MGANGRIRRRCTSSYFTRGTGLPQLAPEDRVLLRDGGRWLVHARGREVRGYRLHPHGQGVQGEREWQVRLDGDVAALAESRYGVLVVTRSEESHTDLWRIADRRAHHVARVPGASSNVAALGASAFIVASRPGHLDATLVEVDLYRRVIVSERPLGSAQVELSTDVTGTHLGLLDLSTRTFQVMNPAAPDPCSPPSTTGAPGPGSQPSAEHGLGCSPSRGAQGCCCGGKQGCPPPSAPGPAPGGLGGQPPPGGGSCQPGDGGVPTAGGGSVTGQGGGVTQNPPGGGPGGCVADLGWRARFLAVAGGNIVAADDTGRNVAVLAGADLRVLHTRLLDRGGAMVVVDPTSPMVLLYHRSGAAWEVVHTDTLLPGLGALEQVPLIDPADAGKVFTGGLQTMLLITPHANATGTVTVLVLPVLEAGQTFNDGDFPKFAAYLERAAFSRIRDYYFENSFGLLKDIRYQIYGLQTGPAGGLLHLPKLVADYFYPPYDPARVELRKPFSFTPYTLVFDGREALTLHVQGATGGRGPKDITFEFPAFLVENSQPFFPAQFHFAGTEKATLSVTLPSGTNKTLTLQFLAKNIDINTEAEVANGLSQLASYLDGVFAAAEAAAGIAPRLFTTPKVKRIKQQGMDFGVILAWVNHADTSGARLDITGTSASGPINPLGFGGPVVGHIVMDGSAKATSALQNYLQFTQVLAEEDAGIDFTQRYLADVVVTADAANTVVRLAISDQDGGPGASVNLTSSNDLGDLFDTAASVPNSNSTADNSNAMRDLSQLIDDAFTDAVARQAPAGSDYGSLRVTINDYFAQFDSILIGQIGVATYDPANPDTAQPSEQWTTSAPKHGGLRSVDTWTTGQFGPYKQIQAQKPWNFTFFNSPADFAVMCHELGHALGYRDLYQQKDYRQDLAYLGTWSIMDSHPQLAHHAAYHKWESGWIPQQRVVTIPPTDPGAQTDTEILLVPVEYWNDSLVAQARAAFGAATLPVIQIIELDLGGDGAVIDRVEARQTGVHFSQNLPKSPAILITNALQPWDDTRYVSTDTTTGDERYRRELQLLNPDNILQNPGDSFDLAKAPALPVKGIIVSVVDRKEIGGISVFRMKVHRENTAYIDLYFTKGDPYYKSPDLWVDWSGDNGPGGGSSSDPAAHHSYPPGQPTDQGEVIHVPGTGTELHWMVARVRNRGQVPGLNVKLNFQVCIPPGAGDKSKNFQSMRFVTVPTVGGGDVPQEIPAEWDVPAGFGGHVCLLVDIADYSIPHDSDGSALASADVWVANNWAQKNVDQYVPVSHSPYDPIEFDFSLHNAGWHSETAYLEPENLPRGMQLTVTPARTSIPAGATVLFRCKLELDDQVIDARLPQRPRVPHRRLARRGAYLRPVGRRRVQGEAPQNVHHHPRRVLGRRRQRSAQRRRVTRPGRRWGPYPPGVRRPGRRMAGCVHPTRRAVFPLSQGPGRQFRSRLRGSV